MNTQKWNIIDVGRYKTMASDCIIGEIVVRKCAMSQKLAERELEKMYPDKHHNFSLTLPC